MAAIALVLVSCGGSSGVLQLGPDTYRVSAESLSLGGAEADVVGTAGRYCAAMGKQINVMSMQGSPYVSYASYASATVNFQCVASSAKPPG
jgi:hypothetical protein